MVKKIVQVNLVETNKGEFYLQGYGTSGTASEWILSPKAMFTLYGQINEIFGKRGF